MNSGSKATQRISKFAPVAEIFRKIDALAAAVKPQEIALDATLGHVLAADVTAPASLPLQSLALRDGGAVGWSLSPTLVRIRTCRLCRRRYGSRPVSRF